MRRDAAAARATLERELADFERLGAQLWAEQTLAELAHIGGRAPSRDKLTEAERRIPALSQLAEVRRVTARFHNFDAAKAARYELGYVNGAGNRIITAASRTPRPVRWATTTSASS